MRVLLYQGISPTSRAIRFITRSQYSHAAFMFDAGTHRAALKLKVAGRSSAPKLAYIEPGTVLEAWEPGGVRCTRGIGDGHAPGTRVDVFDLVDPLAAHEEEDLLEYLASYVGVPYDFRNVLLFLPVVRLLGGRPDRRRKMFCSRLVHEGLASVGRKLLERKRGWEVPPDWVQMSPKLYWAGTMVCNKVPPGFGHEVPRA